MSESNISVKLVQDEVAAIVRLLDPCINGAERVRPELQLKGDLLDRAQADRAALSEVMGGQISTVGLGTVAAFHNTRQEEQRIRRDVSVLSAGHKKLMSGCLDMMYRRAAQIRGSLTQGGQSMST